MPGKDDDMYKTLLESTKAIPWAIDWATKEFVYIGPQIEELLGWPPDSWKSAQDWMDRIHPDFRESVVNFCVTQSENGIDHEADYLALSKNGDYVWIRDVVHVIRKDGVTTTLIGFMFDISERKKLESQLVEANRKLERISMLDGLTGIANRRMYDTALNREWSCAQRNGTHISLIIVDIDHFKEFNDHYGHFEGDRCLQKIAETLQGFASRSTDLCARYGGEEFVILLPGTNREDAFTIAERVRQAICELEIPHKTSAVDDVVTVSAGVSTMTPEKDMLSSELFQQADKMLYLAKQEQRNCVKCA